MFRAEVAEQSHTNRILFLCLRQTFVVRDVLAGSGIKERDCVISRKRYVKKIIIIICE